MNSDAGMIIGESHLVCQDYARTLDAPIPGFDYTTMGREEGPLPCEQWAFVSDGCSGSPDTDIGSRIIILSAMKSILLGLNPLGGRADHGCLTQIKSVAVLASSFAEQLGVNPHAIDATLLCVKHDRVAKGFSFLVAGDGVIGLKQKDATHILEFFYPSGCPYYLNYELDQDRKIAFDKSPSGLCRHHIKTKDGWSIKNEITVHEPYTCFWPANEGDVAFVVTDGVGSIQKNTTKETSKSKTPVKFTEVLDKLVAFKGTQGQFVSRRLRGFQKEAKAEDWIHYDDIGLAAIAWEEADNASDSGK